MKDPEGSRRFSHYDWLIINVGGNERGSLSTPTHHPSSGDLRHDGNDVKLFISIGNIVL